MTPKLGQREIAFLDESNRIENLSSLTYQPDSAHGNAGAWLLFRTRAREKQLLQLEDLSLAQKLLMEEQERAGEYIPRHLHGRIRGPENQYNVRVGDYIAPSWQEVPRLMDRYLDALHKELRRPTMTPIDICGAYHQRFEKLHPYADGNGRTGRNVANYILAFFDWPILVFTAKDRHRYYAACSSQELMKEYCRDKYRDFGYCLKDGNEMVPACEKGPVLDRYICGTCHTEHVCKWRSMLDLELFLAKRRAQLSQPPRE